MGIMQHHDAITGTEKQHVANDYHRILAEAIQSCSRNTQTALNLLSSGYNSIEINDFDFKSCHNLNISHCDVSEHSGNFIVTLYNPLAHSDLHYVRIPVNDSLYSVRDRKAVPVQFQVVPIPDSIRQLSYRNSSATLELVFLAKEVPPLGFKSYFVERRLPPKSIDVKIMDEPASTDESHLIARDGEITIGNRLINLTFDATGHLAYVYSNGVGGRLNQEFYYYEGAMGNNNRSVYENRSSGAYIFRPNSTARVIQSSVSTKVIRGSMVDEFHQVQKKT